MFNLTVTATNIISASTSAHLIIHVIDLNDNAPQFVSATTYFGNISEAALRDSMVLDANGVPLVIQATDLDSNDNARLHYEILDKDVLDYFAIDSFTGAIHSVATLDFETIPEFNFSVQVSDAGNPPRRAHRAADVVIKIIDVNDCPPRFSQNSYHAVVVLPTYSDVRVIRLEASDPDTVSDKPMSFSIIAGNEEGIFGLDEESAVVRVLKSQVSRPKYELQVQVSDGRYHETTWLHVSVQREADAGFHFSQDRWVERLIGLLVTDLSRKRTILAQNGINL